MSNKSKGNLLITFILLVSLSITIFAFISFIGTRMLESGVKVSEVESFYAAEAGLNKAIWYLATPVASGGRGLTWRAIGSYEAFGRGGYYMTAANTSVSHEVLVMSTGEVHGISKTVSQIMDLGGLPAPFDYAVYSNGPINMSGNAAIQGDIFVNGNTHFAGSANVSDGYVYHPTGSTISGAGTYTDGGAPDPLPTMPMLDTSFYTGKIAIAQGVAAGDVTYSNTTVSLLSDIYVKGNVNISGTTTFTGPGCLVATGNIGMSGSTYGSGNGKFIAGGNINITGNSYTSGSIFYSPSAISASGNTRVNAGGFISNGTIAFGGNINLSGFAYSTGALSLSGNPSIRGALVSGSFVGVTGIGGSTNIVYDDTVFPDDIPPGFSPSSLERKHGTWKGD